MPQEMPNTKLAIASLMLSSTLTNGNLQVATKTAPTRALISVMLHNQHQRPIYAYVKRNKNH